MANLGFDEINNPQSSGDGSALDSALQKFPDLFNDKAPSKSPQDSKSQPQSDNQQPAQKSSQQEVENNQQGPTQAQSEDSTNYDAMPWSEVGLRALENSPSSAWGQVKNVGSAFWNYDKTAKSIYDTGAGIASKIAGAAGVQQDPKQKTESEALVNSLIDHYKTTYGSSSGFKKELANDPFSVGMDVASLIPGVEAVGGAGKLADIGKLADVGKIAAKTAGVVGKVPVETGKYAAELASGVPKSALDLAQAAGRSSDPIARKVFKTFSSGNGDAKTIADAAEKSVSEASKAASDEFVKQKGSLATQPINPKPIHDAIDNAIDQLGPDAKIDHPNELSALTEMKNNVSDRTDYSAVGMHNLKVGLNNLISNYPGANKGLLGSIPKAVKDTISSVDPKYSEMMDYWQNWRDQINSFRKDLGVNPKTTDAQTLAKLMSTMKSPTKMTALQDLSKTNAGKYLPQMLAGMATSRWFPNWSHGVADIAASGIGFFTGHPEIAAGMALASPKIAGKAAYAAGAAPRVLGKFGKVLGPTYRRNIIDNLSRASNQEAPDTTAQGSIYKKGGRINRKSGGKVGYAEATKQAMKMISLVNQIKRSEGKKTSSLLNVDDSSIVHALSKANEAI